MEQEPDVADDFVARCRALAPTLAERAMAAEELRRLADDTVAAAAAADLFAAVVPTSLGGHGLGLESLAEGTRELSRGCPASGWTLSFLVLHGWLLAKFPEPGRERLFADGRLPLAPAPLAPTGRAVPDGGGMRISGRWEWATGIAHADWVMVHAVQAEPEFETWFAVLPIEQVEVEDVWFTSGMRATGSNTVVVRDRFVPDDLLLRGRALLDGSGAAAATGDGMAGLPVPPVLGLTAAAAALGAAEAAVDAYRCRLQERVLAYTLGDRAAEQPAAQVRLATALSDVAAARHHWRASIDELVAAGVAGEVGERHRVAARLAAAATVRASRRVVSDVCAGAGASTQKSSHPLQRLQRDVETLQGHVMFDWDRTAELAGRFALGLPLRPADLV